MTNTMNRLLATASIAALTVGATATVHAADLLVGAAPIVVQELTKQRTISGTVGLFGSYSLLDNNEDDGPEDDFDSSPWSIGGDAKVDIPFANDAWSLQIDQYGEAMFLDCENSCTTSENYTGGYLAAAHLTFREMDRYLVGVFGGGGAVFTASSSNSSYAQWLLGVEGQAYFGNLTLFGQGGYMDTQSITSSGEELLHNAWFLRGVGRAYMAGGDGKLEGEIGWATGDQDTSDSVDVWNWGVEYEHAVWSFGDDGFVSIFGRYDGLYYDEDNQSGGDDATAHIFKIGLRMDLNNENPLMRERYGVAVDTPNTNRILGHTPLVE